MPVEELQSRAQVAFQEIQNQMQALAPLVAKEKGWTATDYRDVIRELKKQQFVGDAILPHYQSAHPRARGDHPAREHRDAAGARDADRARERGRERGDAGAEHAAAAADRQHRRDAARSCCRCASRTRSGENEGFDDFTFEAASWTLTAHEGRPGHELQFAAMVEKGVSIARAIFAFNSVNVEGWALYAEAELQPYEPLEGQLVALQHRLLRAARAFLDPGLQRGHDHQGRGVPRAARGRRALGRDGDAGGRALHLPRARARRPSYFVGYSRLLEIRGRRRARARPGASTARSSTTSSSPRALLPPSLLRKAVMEEFIPAQRAVRVEGRRPAP